MGLSIHTPIIVLEKEVQVRIQTENYTPAQVSVATSTKY